MVMVHYLDSETPHQRAATLARLEALRPPIRNKLLEIVDVDGSPVAVTLFLSSFVDFATWLDSVSADQPAPPPLPPPVMAAPVAEPSDFTRAFHKLGAPAVSLMPPRQPNEEHHPAPPPPPAGDFTRAFRRIDEAVAGGTPTEASAGAEQDDTPTLIMAPVKAPRPSEPAQAPPPPPPPAPSEGSFTAIFGRLNETSFPQTGVPNAWPEVVAFPPPIAPPAQPALGQVPAQPPAAPTSYAEPSQPGEFTQLFQRISPAAGSHAPSLASVPPAPFNAPEIPRRIETTPAADLAGLPFSNDPYPAPPAALPTPSLGSAPPVSPPPLSLNVGAPPSLGAASAFAMPPAPNFSDARPVPNANGIPPAPASPPPVWGASALPPALGSSLDVGVQSEFTRILGRVAVPPPPPAPMAPPQAGPASGSKAPAKSVMPLLVALNLVVLLTVAIVAYFMLRGR